MNNNNINKFSNDKLKGVERIYKRSEKFDSLVQIMYWWDTKSFYSLFVSCIDNKKCK